MHIPKTLQKILLTFIALIGAAPFAVLLLLVETGPIVSPPNPLSGNQLSRIEQLLLESVPSSPGIPSQQSIELKIDELNLLLGYGFDLINLSPSWTAKLEIEQEVLYSRLSIELLSRWTPIYLNITSEFIEENKQLRLNKVAIGKIQIPSRVVELGLERINNTLANSIPIFSNFKSLASNIETVEITDSIMRIQAFWDPALIGKLGGEAQRLFISDSDRIRIINYYESINEIVTTIPNDVRAISLNILLAPLFSEAREKSTRSGDPITENRTLLQALAIYVNDDDLSKLVGAEMAAHVTPAKFIEVRLLRRQDLAQHVVSTAAIATSAGAEFAELLSTTKEAYDARYRSGFSFSDLTANTVGVTLANYLSADGDTALEIQRRLEELKRETDYMPDVGNNRDGISESDFNAIYVDRNSSEYKKRLEEIEKIVRDRPLFRGLQ
tara:strand:- start:604 stop:1926 length:1323 start_codon:yes stop_codon:yes gene_type:complete